jgi:mRNA-degrading endonuclease RelE of RelBE toxin-antitoxin system
MLILETSIFTKQVVSLLTDEEYREIQNVLIAYPDFGRVIKGSGGLRKLRWSFGKKGKSGGVRVIYYWYVPGSQILMLLIYKKSAQDDLTPIQLKVLRELVEEEYP